LKTGAGFSNACAPGAGFEDDDREPISPQEEEMKRICAILLVALAALTTACASITEPRNRPTEQWDSAYIQAVEEAARNEHRGVDIIWIRPPAARQKAEESGSQ
jgi:hypothetical protein